MPSSLPVRPAGGQTALKESGTPDSIGGEQPTPDSIEGEQHTSDSINGEQHAPASQA